MRLLKLISVSILGLMIGLNATDARARKNDDPPEHYVNKSKSFNSDPDYVPGDYPAPDTKASDENYTVMVDNLDPEGDILDVMREEGDEITYTAIKNKTASVLGYFRTYDGYISFKEGKFNKAELLINVNSTDSGIPGRDNRIISLFFQSMKPELGTAVLILDKITDGNPYIAAVQNGAVHQIKTSGLFTFGAVTLSINAMLQVQWDPEKEILSVQTAEPVEILISDLKLDGNVPALMEECNHKSLGNLIKISCKLRFE